MTSSESGESGSAGSRATRSRLLSNSVFSAAGYALYLPVSLLLIIFVVHRIGVGPYGIWATLTTILSYGGLLDLGVTTPLVKYVAEYVALGQQREINILLSTAMVLYFAVGTAFWFGMALASGWILTHLFHAGVHDQTTRTLYFAVISGFVVALTFSVLQSLLIGLQRADIVATLSTAFNLSSAASVVILLDLGLGVSGLTMSWLGVTVVAVVVNWVIARHYFPALSLNPFSFSWTRLKLILGFSTRVQITSITLALNDQVDRTLIAYALGQSMLGYYAIASRAAVAIRGISFALMSGMLPAASDLSALGHTERLRRLYLRASRYLAIVDFGLCTGGAALAFPLVQVALPGDYGRVAVTMIVILAGYAIWLPNQATTDMLNGIGHPEIRMRADLGFLAIHIPLSLILIWRFGYYGTVVGTSIALAVTRLYTYVAGARAFGVRATELFRSSFLQPLIGGILAGALTVAPQIAGVTASLPMLVVECAIFGAVYITYGALFSLDDYDRNLIRTHLVPYVHKFSLPFRTSA